MIPHMIPKIDDDFLTIASTYTTKKEFLRLLQFLFLKNHSKPSPNSLSVISYRDLAKTDSNWRYIINRLYTISFPAYEENGKQCRLHWLDYILFDDENKIFYYKFCDAVDDNLNLLKKKYPKDYNGLVLFTRINSFSIYKYLKENGIYTNTIAVSCQELIAICDWNLKAYDRTPEFRRRVLTLALEDFITLLHWDIEIDIRMDQLTFFRLGGKK